MSEETFGKVLKQARLSLGLSQMGLARKLGVRASHIDYLEQGRQRPSLTLLNALGDELVWTRNACSCSPESKDLIKGIATKRAASNKRNAWQELLADKATLVRNNVTPKELRVLSHISLLGVFKPRDYLFILTQFAR
jgi:transcriptional regulator with XRE-family HTH domain